jgi:type I restriction-modification system, R subunit
MQHVYGLREWNREQRRWLDRIAKQLKENQQVVVDAEFLQDFSKNSGGPDRLNRILDDQLETVRNTLASHLWGDTA